MAVLNPVMRSLLGLGTVLAMSHILPFVQAPKGRDGAISPRRPGALAMSPGGVLYIADDARDEILALEPNGQFKVVAGTGVSGFSGDGGAAIDAKINDPNGMTFGPNGTLYFADSGNHRIRAISPIGVIQTVAGGGTVLNRTNPSQKIRATRLALRWPVDVKFGPNGQLYIADQGASKVWKISVNGYVREVVGDTRYFGLHGRNGAAVYGSADGPSGLVLNSKGDLYLAGSATKTLLMVKPQGILTRPFGNRDFYPRGDGGFGVLHSGEVIAMDNQSIVKVGKTGFRRIVDFQHKRLGEEIRGFLPNGIAVSRNGTIYCDTYAGNGYSNCSAIVAIEHDGKIKILWRSSLSKPSF